jgi:hypothetical protein
MLLVETVGRWIILGVAGNCFLVVEDPGNVFVMIYCSCYIIISNLYWGTISIHTSFGIKSRRAL